MKNWIIFVSVCCVIAGFAGCDKEDPSPQIRTAIPAKVQLVFPLKNSECNEGRFITDTESTITFEWRSEEDSVATYELHVTNLFTSEEISVTTNQDTIPVVLPRATAFSWFVISRSSGSDSSATSEVWKFYNSGDGIQAHVPFPAEIISPKMSASVTAAGGTVTLDWEGADIDNDIVGYDVYFGDANPPELLSGGITQTELTNVNVTSGNIYYWSVTTKDAFGNESESGVYQFKVK